MHDYLLNAWHFIDCGDRSVCLLNVQSPQLVGGGLCNFDNPGSSLNTFANARSRTLGVVRLLQLRHWFQTPCIISVPSYTLECQPRLLVSEGGVGTLRFMWRPPSFPHNGLHELMCLTYWPHRRQWPAINIVWVDQSGVRARKLGMSAAKCSDEM